jgi:hypothetical protein
VSVPNDAFWSLENPLHATMWGEGAFEELRRLLPERHVVLRQVPLRGSAIVLADGPPEGLVVPDVSPEADRVPSHLIVAFGPEAGRVAPGALVGAFDAEEERRRERQRESDLAVFEARLAELEPPT